MALTLLMATIALQAGQATPTPKAATPKPPAPDVLLAYADESVETEKSFTEGKLDASRLLFLQTKRPVVACYGRLAEAARDRQAKAAAIVDLVRNGGRSEWSRERSDTLRKLMDDSPFRQQIRDDAAKGYPMPTQFHRLVTIEFEANGERQSVRLPYEPLGKTFELPADSLRLASPPQALPASLTGPRKRGNAIACVVPRTTSSAADLPLMQAGLKLLAAQERANEEALADILPPNAGAEVTEVERAAALQDLSLSFAAYGFPSAEAAKVAFLGASLHKSTSIGVMVTPKTPESEKNSIGWTVLGL